MIYDPNYDPGEQGTASEQVERLRKNAYLKSVTKEIRSLRDESVDNVSAKQERFKRLIRDGVALEIRNAILESRRELDQHQKMGRFTKTSQKMADDFRKYADGFLQRKLLLEKLENGIEELRGKLSGQSTPTLELKLKHAIENANKIKEECITISERLTVLYEQIEQQVRKDQAQEQKLKETLNQCLEHLSNQERGKLLVSINQKTEKITIEQRITFYSQLITQFAQKIPAIRDEEVLRLFELAYNSYTQKDYKEALSLLDQVFKFERQHLRGHRLRADIYKEMGNKVAFMCELRMIVKIDFAEACDFYLMADVLSEAGQMDEAFGFYEDAVKHDANNKYLERLGDVCVQLRRWYRAIQVYQQILGQSPTLGRVMHKLGRALLENNREDEAFDILRQAIQISDDNADSRVCAGRIYRKHSAFQDALESFQRAIELDANNMEAYYWWGAMMIDRGETEEALRLAQKAVELDTQRVRNRILLAKTQGALAHYSEALETLDPCLSAQTPSVDVLLTYSEMSRNSNNLTKALDILGGFVKRFPHQPQVRAEYGILLVQAGRLEESREYLQPPGKTVSSKLDLTKSIGAKKPASAESSPTSQNK